MTTIAIVGAGQGLGAAVARRFGAEGFAAGLISRNQERADGLAAQLAAEGVQAAGFAADVRDPESLARALEGVTETLGPIEVLQYSPLPQKDFMRPVLETTPADLVGPVEFSIYGPVAAVHQVLPGMRFLGENRGTILFVNGGTALTPQAHLAGTSIAFRRSGRLRTDAQRRTRSSWRASGTRFERPLRLERGSRWAGGAASAHRGDDVNDGGGLPAGSGRLSFGSPRDLDVPRHGVQLERGQRLLGSREGRVRILVPGPGPDRTVGDDEQQAAERNGVCGSLQHLVSMEVDRGFQVSDTSTAVTRHPSVASQIASSPRPQPRSSAKPVANGAATPARTAFGVPLDGPARPRWCRSQKSADWLPSSS